MSLLPGLPMDGPNEAAIYFANFCIENHEKMGQAELHYLGYVVENLLDRSEQEMDKLCLPRETIKKLKWCC
jgi:hypothetical protein